MGKGPNIESVKPIIKLVYQDMNKADPGVTAKEVMNGVYKKFQELKLSVRPNWPKLSSIKAVIKEANKPGGAIDGGPKDVPWSIISLSFPEYYIPPEALPYVLRIWALALDKKYIKDDLEKLPEHEKVQKLHDMNELVINNHGPDYHPLTIREALWVARLYLLFKSRGVDLNNIEDVKLLWSIAGRFALGEKTLGGAYPITEEGILAYWLNNDSLMYYFLPDIPPHPDNLATKLVKEFEKRFSL